MDNRCPLWVKSRYDDRDVRFTPESGHQALIRFVARDRQSLAARIFHKIF
jgi:hypothetical protein